MSKKGKSRAAAHPTGPAFAALDPGLVAVLVLTLAVYLPVLGHDFVNWDDDQYVYNNPDLTERSMAALGSHFLQRSDQGWTLPNVMGNYHPLTMLSLHVDRLLSRVDSAPSPGRETPLHATVFHATSLLFHLANTWLVFLVVKALLEAVRMRAGGGSTPAWREARPVALVAALLFGVSPLHVESVAWVSERKDVLYTFFFLLSLRLYFRYLDTGGARPYVGAVLAFLLSLLSKGQAVTLAPTLLLVDYVLRRPWRGRALLDKLPFFALALVFGLIALHAQRTGGNVLVRAAVHPAFMRPLFASFGLVQYVARLAAPFGLLAHYRYALATRHTLALWAFYLPMAGAMFAATGLLLRRARVVGFGPAWFLVNVAPVLQLLPVGSAVMADRYTYLPSVGLFVLAGLGLAAARSRWPVHRHRILGACALYVVGIGVLALIRVTAWRNSLTLWSDELTRDPESAIAYNNIAGYKFHVGDHEAAKAAVERSIALDGEWYRSYANRAVMHDLAGEAARARADYDRSLALKPDQPLALNNRGKLKQEAGDPAGALLDFERAIALSPRPAGMFYANRAEAKAALGSVYAALDDYTRAIALEPADPGIRDARAILRAQTGDRRGALEDFSEVVRLLPRSPYAYLNRARARVGLGDCPGARSDVDRARNLTPRLPEGVDALLAACAPSG